MTFRDKGLITSSIGSSTVALIPSSHLIFRKAKQGFPVEETNPDSKGGNDQNLAILKT